jgi:hypothetical protein
MKTNTSQPESTLQPKLTFDQLSALEPKIQSLRDRVANIKDDNRSPYFCANEHWYGYGGKESIREEVYALVGDHVVDDPNLDQRLATSEAYDTVYRTLYDMLPDCRNCCCLNLPAIKRERGISA